MFSQATAQHIEQQNNSKKRLKARLSTAPGGIAERAIQTPILADTGTVITGALRLRAAPDIGLVTVPVIEPYHGERHAN
jgi:hypothetical protein